MSFALINCKLLFFNYGKFLFRNASILSVSYRTFSKDMISIVFLCVLREMRNKLCKLITMGFDRAVMDISLVGFFMELLFRFLHTMACISNFTVFRLVLFTVH